MEQKEIANFGLRISDLKARIEESEDPSEIGAKGTFHGAGRRKKALEVKDDLAN
jgi:hypothetical protein